MQRVESFPNIHFDVRIVGTKETIDILLFVCVPKVEIRIGIVQVIFCIYLDEQIF